MYNDIIRIFFYFVSRFEIFFNVPSSNVLHVFVERRL